MKKLSYSGALLTLFSCAVHAQSTVTLYGIVDTSIRYTTNQATSTGRANRLSMAEGAFNGPRWGLLGTEDLGGGWRAIFDIENGFNSTNGQIDQQGQMFGRQAWLGLSEDRLGTVKLGRQYGTAYNFIVSVDPISTGNYAEINWEIFLTGVRYDNTVNYTKRLGNYLLEAQYSNGNVTGSNTQGRTMAAYFEYASLFATAGVTGQQSIDATGKRLILGALGGKYTYSGLTGYLYYIHSSKDAGFHIGTSGTTQPLANTSIAGNYNTSAGAGTQTAGRKDRVVTAGLSYLFSPALRLTGAYMVDWVDGISSGTEGKLQSAYAVLVYSLSKRTDVYAEVDRSHLSGAAVSDVNSLLTTFGGAATRVSAGIGVRTRF